MKLVTSGLGHVAAAGSTIFLRCFAKLDILALFIVSSTFARDHGNRPKFSAFCNYNHGSKSPVFLQCYNFSARSLSTLFLSFTKPFQASLMSKNPFLREFNLLDKHPGLILRWGSCSSSSTQQEEAAYNSLVHMLQSSVVDVRFVINRRSCSVLYFKLLYFSFTNNVLEIHTWTTLAPPIVYGVVIS